MAWRIAAYTLPAGLFLSLVAGCGGSPESHAGVDASPADAASADADRSLPGEDAGGGDAGSGDAGSGDAGAATDGPRPAKAPAYGHYFATRAADTPAEAAALCEHPGVKGVVWRQTWRDVEPAPGSYDFSGFDAVLDAIAASSNPGCQLWLFVEWRSYPTSPQLNPCPVYLQDDYSAINASGDPPAYSCFMWEPVVVEAFKAMLTALAARFDASPRVEGLILQESALGFNGAYSQDVADGGSYTAERWRDALIAIIEHSASVFATSRTMPFMNFLRGGQAYLYDVSAALAALSDDRGCFSGPDILPNNSSLYNNINSVYEVLTRHDGCRANSAQNDSYAVPGCDLSCIFDFAVSGTFGDFDETAPYDSGLCVNSYLFWNHREVVSPTGLSWTDALPVIAANPYGTGWTDRCLVP
jgi:hypothetical protein